MNEISAATAPTGLLCNLLSEPDRAFLTDPRPKFTWIVPTGGQSESRIVVGKTRAGVARGRGDLWDSGWISTSQSLHVPYSGSPLPGDSVVFWRVQLRDSVGKTGAWSEIQRVRTGEIGKTPPPITDNSDRRAVKDGGRTLHFWDDRPELVVSEIAPERIVALGGGRYFVDFGRAWFATVSLRLPGGARPAEIALHLGERLAGESSVDRKPPGSVVYRQAKVRADARRFTDVVIPPLPYHSRAVAVKMPRDLFEVAPIRAIEIENWPGELRPEHALLKAVHTRFDDDASEFQSSHDGLNAVWNLCKHTFKASSALGVSVDGDRERTPYEADAYIAMLGHCAVDREFAFWRHTSDYLFARPTWPTEWAFHMIFLAHADYWLTGDISYASARWDKLRAKLLPEKIAPGGLLRAGAIVDWPPAERDGYNDGRAATDNRQQVGPEFNTVANAFAIAAREKLAELADALGKRSEAAALKSEAVSMRAAFLSAFLDPKRGLFTDGVGSDHVSLHANLFPLAFDLVPKENVGRVADFVASKGMACSVYAAQYLMEALYKSQRAADAFRLLTARNARSWRHMLDLGATMTTEAWDPKYKPNLTFNQAWGAVPANIVPRFVFGITPLEPGFGRIRIAPAPGGLKHARIVVPTIRGPIAVSFDVRRSASMEISLPGNVVADIVVPGAAEPRRIGPGVHKISA